MAFLREPLAPGTHYVPDPDPFTWDACPSPYDVSPDAPRIEPGITFPQRPLSGSSQVTWITARSWLTSGANFDIEADLGNIIDDHGVGVYTVLIWAEADGEDVALTNYSIFVE